MPRCVAIGCNNNGNHSFPKDIQMRKQWEKATKIRNFKASGNSRLCSDHFRETDFRRICSHTGQAHVHRYLKKTAVPSVFAWNKGAPSINVVERQQRYLQRMARKELFVQPPQHTSAFDEYKAKDLESSLHIPDVQVEVTVADTTQPIENMPDQESSVTISTQTPHILRLFSSEDMLSDPKSVLFYTGLEDINKFHLVLSTLLPTAHYLKYRGSQILNLSIEDQFLMMLVKLRRNKPDFEISKIFGVSITEVGNIFITWINFSYELWSLVNIWPSRSLVDYYMPDSFKQNYPKTRVIVDGTEVPITKPSNPVAQQATFNSYKHNNTIKFLIGATPGGLISYCSEGYAGSTSDRQITERSSLITLCDEGDSIMADRGFNVQDMFEHKNITINTPSFLRGLTQLPGIKLRHDRKLAKNRIHIERLIGLTKTFKILKSEVNPYYVPLLSRIFFVCAFLCNFREGIVNNSI